MAKRRLNKRFLGMLGGGALGIAVLGVGALKLKNRFVAKHPEKFLAAGREALANKDYATARDNLMHAAALSHPDAALDVLIGDALNGLSNKDPDNVAAARGMWEQALTVDSSNIAARDRMIHFWRDQLDLHSRLAERAQAASKLQDEAKHLLEVDPSNHLALANQAEAALEGMLDGVQFKPVEAKAAEETLAKLQLEDPADSDLPYYIARADVWQGQEAARSEDTEGQARFFAKAAKVMADAVRDQPGNASMHFRYGEVLLNIGSTEGTGGVPTDETKERIIKAVNELDRARQLVTSDDPRYVEISLYDARLVQDRPAYVPNGPMGGAPIVDAAVATPAGVTTAPVDAGSKLPARVQIVESIYRDVLSHRPNDPATRIALAELLGSWRGRRKEAIALLSQPMVDDHPVPGIKGTLLSFFQAEANVHLLSLEIDQVEATRDAQDRKTLLTSADALCDRVYGRSPDSANVLGLKGRLQLVHGQVVEATQTLRHALALTDPQDGASQRSRFELMYHLARACMAAQQTGEAKQLATQIVAAYGRFIPARMMLAQLLISEHDYVGAKKQIDFLESILPGNPELTIPVERMRVATLDPTRDAGQIKAYYQRLPEATRDEKMDKAQLATLVNYDDEALRLATLVHAQAPGDVEAATALTNWYESHGQKQKASDTLREALAINPSNSSLLALQIEVDGKSSASAGLSDGSPSVGSQATGQAPADAFSTEVAEMEVARSAGDRAALDAHLAAAEKLKPDDPRVWDAMFSRALESANWDRASVYLEKLATGNADHAGGLLYRVRYYLARNDMQHASQLALQLTREKPEFSQSWCLLGDVQKASGNYDDAISSFQQSLERQTQNLEAIRGIVDCSYSLGNIEQAKRYIDLGQRVAPASDAFKEMGLFYEMTYGDPQKVIAPRLEVTKTSPDNQQGWVNLALAYMSASQARAKAQDQAASADYLAKARSTLQEASAKFPDVPRFVALFAKVSVESGDVAGAEQAMLQYASRPSQKGRPQTAIVLSDFYGVAGKPDQAVQILNNYLASPFTPTDHEGDIAVELHLSALHAKLNHYDAALAALAANPTEPQIVHQKISLLINAGRTAEAEKALNGLAAISPLSPELLTLKGVAAMNAGRLPEARECFDQVIVAQPNNVYALTERAQAMLREVPANYAAVLTDLSHARDLAPQDMSTRLLIVDVDRRRHQPDDAIRELESAVHIAPADKRVRLTLIDLYCGSKPPRWGDAERLLHESERMPQLADDADLMHAEARMDLGRDDYTKADALIRAAMDKAPADLSMVHTYYDILLSSKAYEQLLSHSAQLLASKPGVPSLWWVYPYRAEALVRGTGDKAGAAAELESGLAAATTLRDSAGSRQIIQTYATLLGSDAAIKVAAARGQTDPHWYLLAANLSAEKGDADGAVAWVERAMGKFDALSAVDKDSALRLAAASYLAKSQPDPIKSADAYRQLIQRSPNDLESLNNLACILVEPGPAYRPKEALDDSEKAYNLMMHAGQDQPLIKDTYGWTLIANDRSEEGLSLVQDALAKYDFAEGHYHLGEAYLKRQPPNPEDAASELDKAMRMLDQAERDGKPVDDLLKSRVQEELKRARSGLAG